MASCAGTAAGIVWEHGLYAEMRFSGIVALRWSHSLPCSRGSTVLRAPDIEACAVTPPHSNSPPRQSISNDGQERRRKPPEPQRNPKAPRGNTQNPCCSPAILHPEKRPTSAKPSRKRTIQYSRGV